LPGATAAMSLPGRSDIWYHEEVHGMHDSSLKRGAPRDGGFMPGRNAMVILPIGKDLGQTALVVHQQLHQLVWGKAMWSESAVG